MILLAFFAISSLDLRSHEVFCTGCNFGNPAHKSLGVCFDKVAYIYMHMNRIETFIHWKLQQVSNEICEFVFRGYGATEPQQTLDFLEVCAGSHRITSAAAEFGLRATALDDTWLITLSLG